MFLLSGADGSNSLRDFIPNFSAKISKASKTIDLLSIVFSLQQETSIRRPEGR
ncbi:hypothetical protein SAG0136_11200 [Streptococcus agalactiae LMG 14747]|uniref:Uncharacterized protein n=1 Tax=Streptococcus agalactiae LMG 14747 TaxID=1154860 RepID=V6Z7Y1_STRAG|nr:hypothetical protein SAG0136_11200 [Streptococcus agalactiae LMG 14747]